VLLGRVLSARTPCQGSLISTPTTYSADVFAEERLLIHGHLREATGGRTYDNIGRGRPSLW
jgi:hypothetical protein